MTSFHILVSRGWDSLYYDLFGVNLFSARTEYTYLSLIAANASTCHANYLLACLHMYLRKVEFEVEEAF